MKTQNKRLSKLEEQLNPKQKIAEIQVMYVNKLTGEKTKGDIFKVAYR